VTPLFAYGTLCRNDWRRAILGAEYPATPARLAGWRRVALASGYLSVVPDPQAVLAGALIDLDDAGWRIADAWEEVPRYTRCAVVAQTDAGPCEACVYVHAAELNAGAAPFEDAGFAVLAERDVEDAIARFAAGLRAMRP
jgi:gamma-glutamylcyclotransferase (GGCT)/AIG2-like uncharacterized protein YtfP